MPHYQEGAMRAHAKLPGRGNEGTCHITRIMGGGGAMIPHATLPRGAM